MSRKRTPRPMLACSYCRRIVRDECTPEFHAWLNARAAGICARWLDFAAFARDVGLRPSTKHVLARIDVATAHGPNNTRWMTKPEMRRVQGDGRRVAA